MLIILNRALCLAFERIRKSRAKNDGFHLAEGTEEHPQPPGAKCPSTTRAKMAFECPCVDSSVAARTLKKRRVGPSIIVVPKSQLYTWTREFSKIIDETDNPFNMRCEVAHESATLKRGYKLDVLRAKANYGWDDEADYASRLEQTRNVVITAYDSYDSRVRGPAGFPRYGLNGDDWAFLIFDEVHDYTGPFSPANKILKRVTPETAVFFVTGTPIKTGIADMQHLLASVETPAWAQHDELKFCTTKHIHKLKVHLEKYQTALTKKQVYPHMDKWKEAMQGLRHISTTVCLKRSQDTYWPTDNKPILVLPPNYIFERTLTAEPGVAKILTGVYQSTAHEYKRLMAEAKREYLAGGKKGPPPHVPTRYIEDAARKIRAFSVFPYLVTMGENKNYHLTNDDSKDLGPLHLTVGELDKPPLLIRDQDLEDPPKEEPVVRPSWWRNPGNSPYAAELKQLAESSVKWQAIRPILDKLLDQKNIYGCPAKLLIVSGASPVVAFIFWLVRFSFFIPSLFPSYLSLSDILILTLLQLIRRHYGRRLFEPYRKAYNDTFSSNHIVSIMHGGTPAKDRERMVLGFQEYRDTEDQFLSDMRVRVLISTAAIIGKGFDLFQTRVILCTDPHWNLALEYQSAARADRIGANA